MRGGDPQMLNDSYTSPFISQPRFGFGNDNSHFGSRRLEDTWTRSARKDTTNCTEKADELFGMRLRSSSRYRAYFAVWALVDVSYASTQNRRCAYRFGSRAASISEEAEALEFLELLSGAGAPTCWMQREDEAAACVVALENPKMDFIDYVRRAESYMSSLGTVAVFGAIAYSVVIAIDTYWWAFPDVRAADTAAAVLAQQTDERQSTSRLIAPAGLQMLASLTEAPYRALPRSARDVASRRGAAGAGWCGLGSLFDDGCFRPSRYPRRHVVEDAELRHMMEEADLPDSADNFFDPRPPFASAHAQPPAVAQTSAVSVTSTTQVTAATEPSYNVY